MGKGVPEPAQESVMGVKAALIPWDDVPNLRDNCHFPICVVIGGPYLCFLGPSVMSSSTLRILGYVALALSAFAAADGAEAGLVGSDFASFGRLSPVQAVQFGGSSCYYADGWNGRGWYQCGNEWNDGFGWIGPFNLNTFGGSAIRRHHHDGVVASHPRALNPVYPRLEPPRRLGARSAPTSPNFHAGAATVSPGFAGNGFRGGNFHHFHGAGIPHIGAPVSPGFAGGGLHGLGGATGVHIGAPASPGFAGVGGFHGGGGGFHGTGGATGIHIGPPASPGFAGVGGFHAGGGFHGLGGATGVHFGSPASPSFAGVGGFHAGAIGAPASPGFAGGGFHGVGGGGAFQGGGAALGQGGIGHR